MKLLIIGSFYYAALALSSQERKLRNSSLKFVSAIYMVTRSLLYVKIYIDVECLKGILWFLWMVHTGDGVFPHIKKDDYLTLCYFLFHSVLTTSCGGAIILMPINSFAKTGHMADRIDSEATPTKFLKKMVKAVIGSGGQSLGTKHFKLTHFEKKLNSG
ncbi:Uncharacterized protein Rs2_35397 [Raphanus sativus]|nr:Uncharacterized protein Rs2_35397 [Raphanus sativus]